MTYNDVAILINGVALPKPPSDVEPSESDLDTDATTRSLQTGVLKRNRIRANVHKLALTFKEMTPEQYHELIAMLTPSTFTVKYWDDVLASYHTGTFYAGDRHAKYFIANDLSIHYQNITVDIVEV